MIIFETALNTIQHFGGRLIHIVIGMGPFFGTNEIRGIGATGDQESWFRCPFASGGVDRVGHIRPKVDTIIIYGIVMKAHAQPHARDPILRLQDVVVKGFVKDGLVFRVHGQLGLDRVERWDGIIFIEAVGIKDGIVPVGVGL